MTTRQNTKRNRGRGGGPTRERTFTTLTQTNNTINHGGPVPTKTFLPVGNGPATFLSATTSSAPKDDLTAANIMSSPFSVASSAGGSPNYQPYDFSNPMHAYSNYHNGFAATMPSVGGNSSYGQQQQQQQQQLQPPFNQPQSQHVPGQHDTELLEKLKETIKNNQHDIFKPIPQPAALAKLYLGPPSSVTPHPEQIPGDRPLGQSEYESSRDVTSGNGGASSQSRPRGSSDAWDSTRRPAGYTASGGGTGSTTNVPCCFDLYVFSST